MATFSKQILSGSTNGRGILVVPTATPGTLIHTAHATALDEIYLWAWNVSGSVRDLVIEWGATGTASDLFVASIPPNVGGENAGVLVVVPGLILSGGLVVRAYATEASKINVFGFVNRIG